MEYLKNDTEHQIYAKKEVILSSGTVGSAKLLLLSGVGPKEHLDELGVRTALSVERTHYWNIVKIKFAPVSTVMIQTGLNFICGTTAQLSGAVNPIEWDTGSTLI